MKLTTYPLRTSTTLLCTVFVTTSFASGFRLPEISISGTALSSALVANPELPGALPYNPAIAAFQKQGELIVGSLIILPDIDVTQSGNTSNSQGKDSVPVPNFFAADHINKDWSWGVGVNAPFGLETKWKAGTFPTFGSVATTLSSPAIAGLEPEHSKIEMLNVNPNVAYQLNSSTSIALGIDNYQVRKLIFNTQSISITGSGQDYGWNIGLLHVQSNWSIGLSYRSSVKVDLDGTVGVTGIPATDRDAEAEMEFPSLLQIGARYKVDDKLAVELDVEQTGWSSFDTIEVKHSGAAPITTNPIASKNDWDDAIAYRLGATYDLSPSDQLRFGYAFDETPGNDDFFSARVPGNDRQTLSVGLAHELAGWTVEFAYMYVKADDRKITAPAGSYLGRIVGTGDTDPNGTDAYNGTYGLTAHLIGIGVNTHF